MLACSCLIESSSKLLATRIGIKALSSSILGWIRRPILELLALEWQKFHTFELEYLWSQLANLDQILYVASLGWGKGYINFWGRMTLAHWTQVSDRCPLGYLFKFALDKWTASSEFGTYRLCEQRRFRRACAFAQSRQNLNCSLVQAVSQEEPSDRKPDPWPLWMAGHAQFKFVMTECSKTNSLDGAQMFLYVSSHNLLCHSPVKQGTGQRISPALQRYDITGQ